MVSYYKRRYGIYYRRETRIFDFTRPMVDGKRPHPTVPRLYQKDIRQRNYRKRIPGRNLA